MNEDFKKANESLPAEEKEQLQKYQKKGITKITQSVDQQSGEILSTETTYSSEKKRVKGTFGISDPEEIIRLTRQSKIRAINTMLAYVIDTIDWNNEFSICKKSIAFMFSIRINKFLIKRKFIIPIYSINNIGQHGIYSPYFALSSKSYYFFWI